MNKLISLFGLLSALLLAAVLTVGGAGPESGSGGAPGGSPSGFAEGDGVARPIPGAGGAVSIARSPALIPPLLQEACADLADFDNSLEQPNYCVYYNDPPTSDADANLVVGYVQDYWDLYRDDFGFNEPEFTAPQLEVRIEGNSNCNGSAWDNNIKIFDGCFSTVNPEFMQYVTGHEVFHRVQFAHDPDWASTWSNSAWIYEGTARNMEDVSFANVDTWANCLAVPFSYCDEVNDYLGFTNADITSWGMRYESNLFWTFFREQFGANLTEPQRGVDALLELWNQLATAESVAAVNNALAVLSPGTSFDDAFRQFAVANYTKDLTALPDASYEYADEKQVGNPAPYGPLVPANGGTISSGSPATWNAQTASRYGARYYSATPHADNCPVVTANFERTGGSTEFYHVITQKGSALNTHVAGSGAGWTQSFLNDGLTRVVAIIGGQSNSATVNVQLSCATPVLDIELPNTLAPAYVGPAASPDDIVVQVAVTNGSPTGPVVAGLTNADFQVEVGGIPALVTGGGFVQEEYFLLVDTPIQGSNGPYDLEVFLESPDTSTVIASDLESEAVVYDNTDTDHVIVTDVSGSMGSDGKLTAARNAANLFIDATNSTEGLGLVAYDHNVVDTLGIQFATLPHRNTAHDRVNAYTPSGATSIGDGLDAAVSQRASSATGNERCQFTLLSDGMENSALFWADVEDDVVDTGCPVMSIAFGQASSELLMQEIAAKTGGASYYNDVFVSSPATAAPQATTDAADAELSLGDTYLHALCQAQGCERLLSIQGTANKYGETITYTIPVDDSMDELVAVLDWTPLNIININSAPGATDGSTTEFALALESPSGDIYGPADYDFENSNSGHVGHRIPDPEAGQWQATVLYLNEFTNRPYQLLAFGETDVAVKLLLPAVQGLNTGDYFPLYAIWIPGGQISATVKAPDGLQTIVPLFDDGQHGDGKAGDGFFGGLYTLVTEADAVEPEDEGVNNPPPVAEGAYQIDLLAQFDNVHRETKGAFAVPAGDDANNDNLPDDFIAQHCPGAPGSDADLDQLSCADEYFTGTDPNNSDTDGDGESDHSEAVLHGLDPLAAGDDMIEAPDFLQTSALDGGVLLNYDVKTSYTSMHAWRAPSADGPWNIVQASLPLTGVYTDTTVTNDTNYYYCVQARNAGNHWSAVVCSEEVQPRVDPVHPEAAVLINDGAPNTTDPNVILDFIASDETHETGLYSNHDAFDDIVQVQISNDPSMSGATWQEFQETMPWQLTPGHGYQTVYVRFRDANGNESVGIETATIFLEQSILYLPAFHR